MADYMLVRHKVKDFDAWKLGFDADFPNRANAGLARRYLLRDLDDMNEVVILFEIGDPSRAREFAGSKELRETMEKAGVIGKPEVHFLTDKV